MQQNSVNAYNYYVKLILDLIWVYSASWFNNQTKISIFLLVITGLQHYGCEIFFCDSTYLNSNLSPIPSVLSSYEFNYMWDLRLARDCKYALHIGRNIIEADTL